MEFDFIKMKDIYSGKKNTENYVASSTDSLFTDGRNTGWNPVFFSK